MHDEASESGPSFDLQGHGFSCPWCGEPGELQVDPSGGRRQRLVEDCWVCCRPIVFVVELDAEGDATVAVSQE